MNRPAKPETHAQRAPLDAKLLSPSLQAHSSALVSQHDVPAATIARLLGRRGPPNIARLVVAKGIGKAIQRMLGRWRRPHVGQEILERTEPARTDLDASAAVSRVGWLLRVAASPLHASPAAVLSPLAFPVRSRSRATHFGLVALAALGVAICEIGSGNRAELAALATTQPYSLRAACETPDLIQAKYGQPAKNFASQIVPTRMLHEPILPNFSVV